MYTKEQNHEYYLKNKDKMKERSRIRYQNHKEEMTEINKLWAKNNIEAVRNIKHKYKNKQKQLLRKLSEILKIKCTNCSCTNHKCIDWHHLHHKKLTINKIIAHGYSKVKFLEEISKCIPLCANCHRRKHHPEPKGIGNTIKSKFIYNIKNNSKCKHCDETHWACLDFHHINPHTKIDSISAMKTSKKYSLQDLQKEIDKCEIVCVNCHRLITDDYNRQ